MGLIGMNMNLILSTRRVSGITIIKYAQNENIKNPNNLNVFGREKSKGFKQLCTRPTRLVGFVEC